MSHDKHYAGRFIAEVVSVDDPEKRCRIKVNVYDIFAVFLSGTCRGLSSAFRWAHGQGKGCYALFGSGIWCG